jgi:hypothetical protein
VNNNMSKKRKAGPSHVVPKIVFSSVFVGVVPACALASCSGDDSSSVRDSGPALDGVAAIFADHPFLGVAQQCFDGSSQPGCGVPPPPFDASDADSSGDGAQERDVSSDVMADG